MSRNDPTEGDRTNSPQDSETHFEALVDVCTMHLSPPTLEHTKDKKTGPNLLLTFGHSNTIKSHRQFASFPRLDVIDLLNHSRLQTTSRLMVRSAVP